MTFLSRLFTRKRTLRSLADDRSGLALLEFAFSLPLVLGLGAYGLEVSNLALLNLRISQIALNLADNASRVGTYSTLSTQQLREVDVNDVLQAARFQGASINLTTNGRIILSSLENVQQSYDTAPVQRIHWQRCLGLKGSNLPADSAYNSSYGTTTTTDGTDATVGNDGTLAPNGMGPTGGQVNAPAASGVMFVEINYLTKPLFGSWLTSPARLNYIASFIVRDRRDFSQLYNPSPAATRLTCNLYSN
ncbi:TadE/TadG family type IV pilus assembly protein [Sphingomonas sp. MMS24-J45]|uniref:TadE/TadG family type IV pilus assembly protein n=1 Tax=Sphingomonas sp. MMS24-J45 TaxID=3238806 RepID=UPI00384ECB31